MKLSQPINVEAVSLEHAPRELLLNKGVSAPKDFTVYGERERCATSRAFHNRLR